MVTQVITTLYVVATVLGVAYLKHELCRQCSRNDRHRAEYRRMVSFIYPHNRTHILVPKIAYQLQPPCYELLKCRPGACDILVSLLPILSRILILLDTLLSSRSFAVSITLEL